MDTARLQILLDLQDQMSKPLKEAATNIEQIGNRAKELEPVFKRAAVIGTAGFAAVAGVLWGSVNAANEAEEVQAQLAAVLKSTGGAAGITAEAALELSSALQRQTTYGDEAILSAENMLLTFTNIGKDIFPETTQTVLDMSTALGQDLKSSAIQLGKALQDPIIGVSALRKVGVNFSEAQQDVIKNLVETGKSAEAQRLILKELAAEFGGSAAAQAKTFAGQMQQMKNRIGDVGETIGKTLVPYLQKIGEKLEPVITAVEKFTTQHPKLTLAIIAATGAIFGLLAVIGTIGLVIPAITAGFVALGAVVGAVGAAFTVAALPVWGIVAAVAAVVAGIVLLIKHWDAVKNFIISNWQEIVAILFPGFGSLAVWVIDHWTQIKDTTIAIWDGIKNFFETIFFAIVGLIEMGLEAMGTNIQQVMQAIATFWQTAWDTIKNILAPIVTAIQTVLTGAFGWMKNIFNATVGPIQSAWTGLWNGIGSIVSSTWESIKNTVKDSINWVIDKINAMIEAVNSVAQKGAGALHLTAPQIPLIPRLAEGGIVTRPTLAMIGEAGPEAVIPLSRASRGGAASSIVLDIHDNTFYGEDDLVDRVAKALTRVIKNNVQVA